MRMEMRDIVGTNLVQFTSTSVEMLFAAEPAVRKEPVSKKLCTQKIEPRCSLLCGAFWYGSRQEIKILRPCGLRRSST